MSRYLFVLWSGGGNVPPQMAVARRLVRRGHRVFALAPRSLADQATEAGCQHLPYRQAPEHDGADRERDLIRDFEARSPKDAAGRVWDRLMFDPLDAFAADTGQAIGDHDIDVVAPDVLIPGAVLAAERAGVPVASLVHFIPPFPTPGVPPFGTGFAPARGILGRARYGVVGRLLDRFYAARLDRLNEVRGELGLAPRDDVIAQFLDVDRLLVLTSKAFDFPASRPANLIYVGPQGEPAPELSGGRSLILVSLSTTYQAQGDVLQRIITALEQFQSEIIVTTGPAIDPASLDHSDHVTVVRWQPHSHLLPRATAVVTHAGHGTVMAALAHGVPLVCLPMGRDQGDIAARVAWHGAGIRLSAKAGPQRIRTAVDRVVTDPTYREAAGGLARAIAADQRTDRAVRELESLAAPVTTC